MGLQSKEPANGILLPEQFFQTNVARSWVHDLAIAELADAVGIVKGTVRASAKQWAADLDWIASTAVEIFSFEWCCRLLDLNANAVREHVLPQKGQ